MAKPTVRLIEEMSVYADFYHTQQHLEAGRNRILNGCKTTDKCRISNADLQKIYQITNMIFDRTFQHGKDLISEFRKAFEAYVKGKMDKALEKAVRDAAKNLNTFNRRTMEIVFTLSDYVIQHEATKDTPVPIADIFKPVDCSVFIQRLEKTWEMIKS